MTRTSALTKKSRYSNLLRNFVYRVPIYGSHTETATNHSEGRTNIQNGVTDVNMAARRSRPPLTHPRTGGHFK